MKCCFCETHTPKRICLRCAKLCRKLIAALRQAHRTIKVCGVVVDNPNIMCGGGRDCDCARCVADRMIAQWGAVADEYGIGRSDASV